MGALIVTGSRHWPDEEAWRVEWQLNATRDRDPYPLSLFAGCAGGVDAIARRWALKVGVQCHVYTADWRTFGKRAGALRNIAMVDGALRAYPAAPIIGLAFPMPGSVGTHHCARYMRSKGIDVLEFPGL